MPEIQGSGSDILALLNIEYFVKEFAELLMQHPNTQFKLTLERLPISKKKTDNNHKMIFLGVEMPKMRRET